MLLAMKVYVWTVLGFRLKFRLALGLTPLEIFRVSFYTFMTRTLLSSSMFCSFSFRFSVCS